MTFAAPLFLVAALAGIIPVLLHMIHRQQAQEVRFSTLRFLKVSVQRTRKRRFIEDAALLLVRVAALVLIALGLAKPVVTTIKGLWGQGATTAVVIVLDNSASMATVDNGEPRWDTAKRAAGKVLDVLHDGDAVALLLTGGPAAPELGRLFHTHETVRQALTQGRVSYERADLAGRLQQARSLLAAAEAPNREIYVITDNQTISWEGLKVSGASAEQPAMDVPVVVVNVNRAPMPNVALRNIHLDCPSPSAGVPIQVTVEVVNTSAAPQQRHLELHVDGTSEAVSPTLNLPAAATIRHEFRYTPDRGGIHRGEVRLVGDDGLPLDNQQFFAVTVDPQIPVAVVKPRRHEIPVVEDSFYLEQALASASAIRTTALIPEELRSEQLADYAVIFCVNLPALDVAAAERLREYVVRGGHVFWICGPEVQTEDYNRMSERLEGQLLPAPLAELRDTPVKGDSWHVDGLDQDHPALSGLREPPSLYKSVLVYKHFRIAWPAQAEGRVLARLDDGQPLLVERTVGAGSVLLLATGVHVEWTNLPLRPLFLPLFSRLTFHLAGAETARYQVLAGAPLVVPLTGRAESAEVEVVRPSGETLRVPCPDKNARTFQYADTHEVGVYLVRPLGERAGKQLAFAVNMDPDESEPASLPAEELKRRFGQHPLLLCDNPDDLAGSIQRLREGQGLWEWFLSAVLVALVFEAFLANRLGGRTVSAAAVKGTRVHGVPAGARG